MGKGGGKGNVLLDIDHGWKAMVECVRQVKHARVKVGVLDSGKGGEEHGEDGITISELAAVHEFGTQDKRIPERSFVRSTFAEQRPALTELGEKLMVAVLVGNVDIRRALNIMGAKLATEIKKKMTSGLQPPLAQSTLRRRRGYKEAVAGAAKAHAALGPKTAAGIARAEAKLATGFKPLIDTGRLLGAVTWAILLAGEGDDEE